MVEDLVKVEMEFKREDSMLVVVDDVKSFDEEGEDILFVIFFEIFFFEKMEYEVFGLFGDEIEMMFDEKKEVIEILKDKVDDKVEDKIKDKD